MKLKLIVLCVAIAFLGACKEKSTYSDVQTKESSVNQKAALHTIIAKEYKDGGSYAYILAEEDGKEYWMAVPNMNIEIGETYYYEGGMVMKDFESKILNKTFDFITFANELRGEGVPVVHNAHDENHVHQTGEEILEEVKANRPQESMWLKDVFAVKEDLKGKEVLIRGKVVKVNEAILGKNWVHVVDGTMHENVKDLTITTTELPKVGEVYNFKGKVILNKDFGMGYVYDILLEEAYTEQ